MSENKEVEINYIKFYYLWIGIGAAAGGFHSFTDKLSDIIQEDLSYSCKLIERPIRAVYNTTRLIGHGSCGIALGGIVAAVPISIPIYLLWKRKLITIL